MYASTMTLSSIDATGLLGRVQQDTPCVMYQKTSSHMSDQLQQVSHFTGQTRQLPVIELNIDLKRKKNVHKQTLTLYPIVLVFSIKFEHGSVSIYPVFPGVHEHIHLDVPN